jgi:hypothetical protein
VSEERFIGEQGEVAESTDAGPILSTRDLLVVLGVHRASEDHKRVAVQAWLRDHEPDPLLRRALERSGYLPSHQASA